MAVTLEQARGAKQKARSIALALAPGAAIGLAKRDGSYVLKVNLLAPVKGDLPAKVDGVPIIYEVTGPITARALR